MKRRSPFLFSLVLLPALLISGCAMQADQAPSAGEADSSPSLIPRRNSQPMATAGAKEGGKRSEEKADSQSEDSEVDSDLPAAPKPKSAGRGRPSGLGKLSVRGPHAAKPEASATPDAYRTPTAGKRQQPSPTSSPPADNGLDENNDRDADPGVLAARGNAPRNMYFKHWGVNPTIDTEEQPRSTFAVDVDTASYTMARSYLERGQLPAEASVRVEEFVNAFDYGYEPPAAGDVFSVHAEAAPSPNRKGYHVLHVGVKGKEVKKSERKAATLVFVVDVSGSMDSDNRLGLVKRSLRLLVGQLGEDDKVGVVTYGSNAREVLQPTSAFNKQRILSVIDNLTIEGATNAEAGLRVGYAMAAKHQRPGRISRVVLCSDGVANVGMTGENGLLATIKSKAK